MGTEITKYSLINYGMKLHADPFNPMYKILEDGKLQIVVTRMRPVDTIALELPDGSLIYLNPSCIEDLIAFEKMIISYEPNF